MREFRLVRPAKEHERQAKEYVEEFYADGSETHGVGGLEKFKDDYDGWLAKLEQDRHLIPTQERVPAETFFLMKNEIAPIDGSNILADGTIGNNCKCFYHKEKIIGMINIRLALNDSLWQYGGNIGYSIRPSERQKGYNKINLFLALVFCQRRGLKAVLLDCAKSNVGSARTMLALGAKPIYGHWHQKTPEEKELVQAYIIDIDAALSKYFDKYDQFVFEYPE